MKHIKKFNENSDFLANILRDVPGFPGQVGTDDLPGMSAKSHTGSSRNRGLPEKDDPDYFTRKVDNKQVSHLEFLNKFVDDLEKMRSEIEENGYAEQHQINYIEELYQLFGSNYK